MKKQDKDIRYFIELDIKSKKILKWGFGNRFQLKSNEIKTPFFVRLYITKGQFNKLELKDQEALKIKGRSSDLL
ncbi:MAG: hypothetical protein L6Q54_14395 [Leptospiraceae bacterium]|nr:hypothetical protein [Leptospiraceae bacterium]MCK6382422.1 hypothetical protein [Leptospiraceae bacterium]